MLGRGSSPSAAVSGRYTGLGAGGAVSGRSPAEVEQMMGGLSLSSAPKQLLDFLWWGRRAAREPEMPAAAARTQAHAHAYQVGAALGSRARAARTPRHSAGARHVWLPGGMQSRLRRAAAPAGRALTLAPTLPVTLARIRWAITALSSCSAGWSRRGAGCECTTRTMASRRSANPQPHPRPHPYPHPHATPDPNLDPDPNESDGITSVGFGLLSMATRPPLPP